MVEEAIAASSVEWTFLRPTGSAANALMWADQIRVSGVARGPYGRASRSLIHDRDVADVAVLALAGDDHVGVRYVLTGPQGLTQVEQAAVIGEAIGRRVRWQELSRPEAEDRLAAMVPSPALDTWAECVKTPDVVTSTVLGDGSPAPQLRRMGTRTRRRVPLTRDEASGGNRLAPCRDLRDGADSVRESFVLRCREPVSSSD